MAARLISKSGELTLTLLAFTHTRAFIIPHAGLDDKVAGRVAVALRGRLAGHSVLKPGAAAWALVSLTNYGT